MTEATNIAVASASSALSAVAISLIENNGESIDLMMMEAGLLAGLVACGGGCNVVALRWAALTGCHLRE